VKDIRVIEEFAMPDEDYPYTEMIGIKNAVDELEERSDKSINKIGFVGLDLIPHLTFQRICDALHSEIGVCDAQDICFKLRSRKSPWEIEII
jgi:Xaa-Pro aminopeptidase